MPILKQVDPKQRVFRWIDPAVTTLLGRRGARGPWPPPERILFLNIWAVGDVVLATPALQALRAAYPNAQLTMLGQAHARELLAEAPFVDEIIVASVPWTRKTGKYQPRAYLAAEFRELIGALRRRRFDLGLDGQADPRGNGLLWLSGARRRVGYAPLGGGGFLTDIVPVPPTHQHSAELGHHLVTYLAGPRPMAAPWLPVSAARVATMRERLDAIGVGPEDRLVAVHPGAGNPVRRWGLDRFAHVIRALRRQPRTRVIALAEPSGYGAELGPWTDTPVWTLALPDLVAFLALGDVFVGADNGPMHIAAAVGARVVGLYGPTSIAWYGPWGAGHTVLAVEPMPCRPCGDRCHLLEPYCMTQLTPFAVTRAVTAQLDAQPRPRRQTAVVR